MKCIEKKLMENVEEQEDIFTLEEKDLSFTTNYSPIKKKV